MPLERLLFVGQDIRSIRVLIEVELRIVDLSPEYEVRQWSSSLATLRVLLGVHFRNLLLVLLR